MLKKLISLTISLMIVITGLILINFTIPYTSEYLGYDLHGNTFLGITLANIILALPGLFIFSWLALVLGPFLTNSLFNYAEILAASLSKIPRRYLVTVFGIGVGLVLANLLGVRSRVCR